MCTNIMGSAVLSGSAKGPRGWFTVDRAYVGYDHPVHAPFEHALSVDFINEAGTGNRLGIELSRASARDLATAILRILEQADAYEGGATSAPPAEHEVPAEVE